MEYTSDTFPIEGIPDLPAASRAKAFDIWTKFMAGEITGYNIDIRAGFLYNMNGEFGIDSLGEQRPNFYGQPDDDVILQMSLKLKSSDTVELVTQAIADTQEAAAEERARLDAQIAELTAKRNSLLG